MSCPHIALLKFDGAPLLPTMLFCTGRYRSQYPSSRLFELPSSEKIKEGKREVKKVYRHFKDDLQLTTPQARDEDLAREAQRRAGASKEELGWSMTRTYVKRERGDSEAIAVEGSTISYFSPLDASGFFLERVCAEAVKRVRALFGDDETIHVHFTAPNYEFERTADGADGKTRSAHYRANIRAIIDNHFTSSRYRNVTFEVGGYDFLYEPYAAYHYYALLERTSDIRDGGDGATYLVFDMGGSTTDVAVVQVQGNDSEGFSAYPLSRSVRRAGAYYDRCILKHLLDLSRVPPRNAMKWAEALERIEQAKIRICTGESEEEVVEMEDDGTSTKHVVDRNVLDAALEYAWTRGDRPLGQALRGFLERAQRQASKHGHMSAFTTIQRVFLAGGSAGVPGLKERLRRELEAVGLLAPSPPQEEKSSEAESLFMQPTRRLFDESDVPGSVVVAAGRTAALVEDASTAPLVEEGTRVLARIVDEQGRPYVFERKDEPEQPDDGESFVLCNVGELDEENPLRLGEEGAPTFDLIRFKTGSEVPTALDVYLRSDVQDFPEEPNLRCRDAFGGEPDQEAWLHLRAQAQVKGSNARIKPFVFHWQPACDHRSPMARDAKGFIDVPLQRSRPPEGVHLCIDFGMTTTAVGLYAPGRPLPVGDPNWEVLTLPAGAPPLADQLRSLLPTTPVSLTRALDGIEEAHRSFGYRPAMSGLMHFVRGAFAYQYYMDQERRAAQGEETRAPALVVFSTIAEQLQQRGGPSVEPLSLGNEATIAGTIDEAGLDALPDRLAACAPGHTLKQIKDDLMQQAREQQQAREAERADEAAAEEAEATATAESDAAMSQDASAVDGATVHDLAAEKATGAAAAGDGEPVRPRPVVETTTDEATAGEAATRQAAPHAAVSASPSNEAPPDEGAPPDEAPPESRHPAHTQTDASRTSASPEPVSPVETGSPPPPSNEAASAMPASPQASASTNGRGAATPEAHWAVGMTHWFEGLASQLVGPLHDSHEQTRRAIEQTGATLAQLAERLRAVEAAEANAPAGLPEETQAALIGIKESLAELARRVPDLAEQHAATTERARRAASEVRARVEAEVEDPNSRLHPLAEKARDLAGFKAFVEDHGYHYPDHVCRKVWTQCQAEGMRLIVLAGVPGSGKSTLARLVAAYCNQDVPERGFEAGWKAYWHLEPVAPSWFSPDSLFGGRHPLDGTVEASSFAEFLMRAEAHYTQAYGSDLKDYARWFVACLDEFNIARPEQYMSNLLSKLEERPGNRKIRLGDGPGSVDIEIHPNVKLFATINTDAASKVLSPKVLDRSFFVRMTPKLGDLRAVMDKMNAQYSVDAFHAEMDGLLEDLSELARAGQSPLGYRALEQAYQYAQHAEAEGVDPATTVSDVLGSYFLSKLPGAFAVNDPEQRYRRLLKREDSALRRVDGVAAALDLIASGLPGQASM
jgi:hypothetical protein